MIIKAVCVCMAIILTLLFALAYVIIALIGLHLVVLISQ